MTGKPGGKKPTAGATDNTGASPADGDVEEPLLPKAGIVLLMSRLLCLQYGPLKLS